MSPTKLQCFCDKRLGRSENALQPGSLSCKKDDCKSWVVQCSDYVKAHGSKEQERIIKQWTMAVRSHWTNQRAGIKISEADFADTCMVHQQFYEEVYEPFRLAVAESETGQALMQLFTTGTKSMQRTSFFVPTSSTVSSSHMLMGSLEARPLMLEAPKQVDEVQALKEEVKELRGELWADNDDLWRKTKDVEMDLRGEIKMLQLGLEAHIVQTAPKKRQRVAPKKKEQLPAAGEKSEGA